MTRYGSFKKVVRRHNATVGHLRTPRPSASAGIER